MNLRFFIKTILSFCPYRISILAVSVLFVGCVGFSSEVARQKAAFSQDAPKSAAAAGRPEQAVSSANHPRDLVQLASIRRLNAGKTSRDTSNHVRSWSVRHKSRAKMAAADSEREKAESVALELAKSTPLADKIKICHDSNESEWWIVLYEDAGVFVELKQYIWSIYKDVPEPFLVQERVSKDRLEAHLCSAKPGMSCEVLERVQDPEGYYSVASDASQEDTGKLQVKSRPEPFEEQYSDEPEEEQDEAEPVLRTASMKAAPSRRERAAPPVKALKKQFAQRPAQAATQKLYQLASSGPLRSEQSLKRAVASDAMKADFRPASARHGELEVAPRGGPPYRVASAPADLGPDEDAPQVSKKHKQTSKGVTSRRELPTYFVFVYGSEMNHPELMAWLDANGYDASLVLDATPGVLEGYDFVWNYYSPSRHGGAVNIQPKRDSKIWGLLVECEDSLMDAFDHKEGHPNYYRRAEKRVPVYDASSGRTVFAWLYMARPNMGSRRDIWPTRDYKSRILEAALFWDFPADYVRKIRDWPTR